MPTGEYSASTGPVRQARLFRNGRNQAVRIPREFEMVAEAVFIYRDEDRLVLQPVERSHSLAEVLAQLTPLEEEFPVIEDQLAEPEEIF